MPAKIWVQQEKPKPKGNQIQEDPKTKAIFGHIWRVTTVCIQILTDKLMFLSREL